MFAEGAGLCAVTPAEMTSASAVMMNLEFMSRLLVIQCNTRLWQADFGDAAALSHLFHARWSKANINSKIDLALFASAERRMVALEGCFDNACRSAVAHSGFRRCACGVCGARRRVAIRARATGRHGAGRSRASRRAAGRRIRPLLPARGN